jgi:hypothetical protein
MTVMTMIRRIFCRLNVHHAWREHSTEDGGRYRRCDRCGKDGTGRTGKTINPFGSINITK